MGRDLYASQGREVYEAADGILGFPLSRLCFEGPEESLNDTVNTQPAVFVTSLALVHALHAREDAPTPSMVAGHSLGELTALTAVRALDFADGLRLVRERGRLMKQAGETSPGGMAAIVKVPVAEIERACREASDECGLPVQIANYNAPEQVVISGHKVPLARAMELLRERGARRVIPLAVSIAAHSPLMAEAAAEYRRAVDATPVRLPSIPVIGNIQARPLDSVDAIRDELAGQLTQPVQWTASVQWMVANGATHLVEIGPKDVLTRLVRFIEPDAQTSAIGDADTLRAFQA
jgi:[acyl-carrier-protein] S-malonyltransferase